MKTFLFINTILTELNIFIIVCAYSFFFFQLNGEKKSNNTLLINFHIMHI